MLVLFCLFVCLLLGLHVQTRAKTRVLQCSKPRICWNLFFNFDAVLSQHCTGCAISWWSSQCWVCVGGFLSPGCVTTGTAGKHPASTSNWLEMRNKNKRDLFCVCLCVCVFDLPSVNYYQRSSYSSLYGKPKREREKKNMHAWIQCTHFLPWQQVNTEHQPAITALLRAK